MRIKILLSLLVCAALYAGCKKDDETPTPDTTAPVITLNGSATVSINSGTAYTDAGASATDNVDGSVSVSNNINVNNPKVSTPGTYTITFTASDAAGNVATATRKVIVVSGAGFTRADYLWSKSPAAYSAHDSDLVTKVASDYAGCDIIAGTGANDIKIGCFLYTLSPCLATVNGAIITLTSPQTFSGSGTIINGTGTLNSTKNKITINYHNSTEGHDHIVVLTKL